MERTEQLSQLYRLLLKKNLPDRYKVTAEKKVEDSSCGRSGGVPPALKVPQDWGIEWVD